LKSAYKSIKVDEHTIQRNKSKRLPTRYPRYEICL
jgi:hypothetical protein